MKIPFSKILLSALLILSFTGCKKNTLISEKQTIIFQYDYINYAWGYQHTGFIIDNGGNILTYNNPEDWNFMDKDMILTEKQVAANIAKCQSSGKKISPEELQKFTSYIKNIASSEVTASKNVAEDAGTAEYLCFQYSGSTSSYKGYLIKTEGDFTRENLNFYSKKVVIWLKDINLSLTKK
jgi:hypothetical protein